MYNRRILALFNIHAYEITLKTRTYDMKCPLNEHSVLSITVTSPR